VTAVLLFIVAQCRAVPTRKWRHTRGSDGHLTVTERWDVSIRRTRCRFVVSTTSGGARSSTAPNVSILHRRIYRATHKKTSPTFCLRKASTELLWRLIRALSALLLSRTTMTFGRLIHESTQDTITAVAFPTKPV